jgi:hypothetical protein
MGHPRLWVGLGMGHPPVDRQGVGAAGSLDDFFEDVFGFGVLQVGETMVTTEGDEVELARFLATFEA